MLSRRARAVILSAAVALSACAPAATPGPGGDVRMQKMPAVGDMVMEKSSEGEAMMAETPAGDVRMEKTPEGEAMADKPTEAMADLPAWFAVALTDVNTGETFTVADLHGRVVLVETLAVWCSKCLQQQRNIQALQAQLGERDDFVSLGLGVDPNESDAVLKEHAARNGFDWKYAVAPREVAREIAGLYGDQFLNPPSTPMLIIDRQGQVHLLPFGIKSVDELRAALDPFLNEAQ